MSDDISKRNAEIADTAKYISQLMNSGISEDEKSGHAVVLLERMRVLFYGGKNIDIIINRHAKKAFYYAFEAGRIEGEDDMRTQFIKLLRLDEFIPDLKHTSRSPYQDPKEYNWIAYRRLNYAKKEKPPVRPTSAS